MKKFLSIVMVSAAALAVAGCGGGGGPLTSTSSTGTGTGTGTTTTYSMGNGTGSSFQSGMIGISSTSVSAGGSTSLQVSIVDQTGTLYTAGSVTITFSSTCISQGLAAVTAAAPSTAGSTANTVVTATGTADATYTAKGCSGSDVITASATVGSTSLTATGTVTVAAAATGSVQFVSATPQTIGLKGTGQVSTSTLVFKVLDSTGAPKPGVTVNFALDSSVGGLALSPSSATSAADGTVQTIVSSGTVATSVTVTASISSPALTTQSSQLTVTTGIPTSKAFSIAVGAAGYGTSSLVTSPAPACPNVEAYNTDGVTVPVTVHLSDRYGNPVLEGTAVTFYTDGGQIAPSCPTADGACTAQWVSADPRPQLDDDSPHLLANGRVVVLATAIGEDWFDDVDGSGFYEPGDAFLDLGEPYDDANENGQYDLGEHFLDYNQNGKWDGPSSTFVGITCTGTSPSSTCTEHELALGASHLIIMSESQAGVWNIVPQTPNGDWTFTGAGYDTGALTIVHGESGVLSLYIGDSNGNPIPAGSSIAVSVGSSVGTTSGSTSFNEGCSSSVGGDAFPILLQAASAAGTGDITVTVTAEATKSVSTIIIPVTIG